MSASRMRSRTGTTVAAASAALALLAGALTLPSLSPASAAVTSSTFFSAAETPAMAVARDATAVELGMRFTVAAAGSVSAVRFYKGGTANGGQHAVSLWSSTGGLLARATVSSETASGWQQASLPSAIPVWPGVTYTVSYTAPVGGYSATYDFFSTARNRGQITVPAAGGVYRYGAGAFPNRSYRSTNYFVDLVYTPTASTPTPAPTPSASTTPTAPAPAPTTSTSIRPTYPPVPTVTSPAPVPTTPAPAPTTASPSPTTTTPAFPNAVSTGVPAGVALTPMSGFVVTTPNTVIDGKDISGEMTIATTGVVIRNSRIRTTGPYGVYVRSGSVSITDSEFTGMENAIAGNNWSAVRVDIFGTYGDGVKGGSNVLLQDSWIHDLKPVPSAHADGLQMQSGVVNMVVRHNTIDVSTADANSALFLAPDFGPSTNGPVLVEGNYLNGGYYTVFCVDGSNGRYFVANITIRNNSFGSNSWYGPARVNVPVTWTGNVWAATGRPVTY